MNKKIYHYRLYNSQNIFIAECFAESYVESQIKMKSNEFDKIFRVEEDGHEIRCGKTWVEDLFIFD